MKMTMKTYKENDVIFEEGEIGDKLYMIKSGRVRVFSQNKYMRELGEGSCFGEVDGELSTFSFCGCHLLAN